jgi:hypothetical protein
MMYGRERKSGLLDRGGINFPQQVGLEMHFPFTVHIFYQVVDSQAADHLHLR